VRRVSGGGGAEGLGMGDLGGRAQALGLEDF